MAAELDDLAVEVDPLCEIALAGYEAMQRAEALRCAHMIPGEPRRLVASKVSNPCSSFIAGEPTGERR